MVGAHRLWKTEGNVAAVSILNRFIQQVSLVEDQEESSASFFLGGRILGPEVNLL